MKKLQRVLHTTAATSIGWFALAQKALADADDYAPSNIFATSAGLPTTSVVGYSLGIGRVLFSLLGVVALVLIIYAGFLLLTSQGESDKVKKGRDTLLWAVVGLIVILSSFGILSYLDSTLVFE